MYNLNTIKRQWASKIVKNVQIRATTNHRTEKRERRNMRASQDTNQAKKHEKEET